ncbi:MAG TPA: right-handed parallel beta-helix repeat-containing protein, partial [Streptosporangiaceae bacterium]
GGGILDLGTLVLRNVRLTGNSAPSGGGLAIQNGAHATISFSELDGNNATGAAGGAIDNSADLVVDHSRLTGNTAHTFGGGVFTLDPGTSRITRTVVARNVAGRTGGGIVNTAGATTVLALDRVVFNRAGSAGGGIFNGGTIMLRFTLVAFNSPDNCSPQGTIQGCRH